MPITFPPIDRHHPEDLLAQHAAVMRNIFVFLGVDPEVKVPAARVFVGSEGEPNALLARTLSLLYRLDRRRLERITGLRFPEWN
jgi:hypothetical protein